MEGARQHIVGFRALTLATSQLYAEMLMLPEFQPIQWSILRRAIFIVCSLLVISYILFDVLDLDGSDFPSPLPPVKRSTVVAEVPKNMEHSYLPGPARFCGDASILIATGSGESGALQRANMFRSSPLDSARARGYRVALPRASIADCFPSD